MNSASPIHQRQTRNHAVAFVAGLRMNETAPSLPRSGRWMFPSLLLPRIEVLMCCCCWNNNCVHKKRDPVAPRPLLCAAALLRARLPLRYCEDLGLCKSRTGARLLGCLLRVPLPSRYHSMLSVPCSQRSTLQHSRRDHAHARSRPAALAYTAHIHARLCLLSRSLALLRPFHP